MQLEYTTVLSVLKIDKTDIQWFILEPDFFQISADKSKYKDANFCFKNTFN